MNVTAKPVQNKKYADINALQKRLGKRLVFTAETYDAKQYRLKFKSR